jgi:hypothetical protein
MILEQFSGPPTPPLEESINDVEVPIENVVALAEERAQEETARDAGSDDPLP